MIMKFNMGRKVMTGRFENNGKVLISLISKEGKLAIGVKVLGLCLLIRINDRGGNHWEGKYS